MSGRIYALPHFAIRGNAQMKAAELARKPALIPFPNARFCARSLLGRTLTESGGRAPERIRIPMPLPIYASVPT